MLTRTSMNDENMIPIKIYVLFEYGIGVQHSGFLQAFEII